MMVMMKCIGLMLKLKRRSQLRPPRYRRLSTTGNRPAVASAFARRRFSFIADQRGAVALETVIVYLFMVSSLLLPLADVALAAFQYVSAWGALRAFGQYVQYNPPPDVTSTSTWVSGLPAAVSGYPINNVQVLCGNTSAGATCNSTNISLPTKYYSYSTTVTLAPMVLTSVLCTSSNTNHCSFTMPYAERFQ